MSICKSISPRCHPVLRAVVERILDRLFPVWHWSCAQSSSQSNAQERVSVLEAIATETCATVAAKPMANGSAGRAALFGWVENKEVSVAYGADGNNHENVDALERVDLGISRALDGIRGISSSTQLLVRAW